MRLREDTLIATALRRERKKYKEFQNLKENKKAQKQQK